MFLCLNVIELSHNHIILNFICNMVYMMSHSWHILYAMKPWLIYANEGFDGGFNTKLHLWGLNYVLEGKY